MGMTSEITKAAKKLTSLEGKLAKVVSNEQVAVAKATAKATTKYATKVQTATDAVAAQKAALQALVAAA